MKTKKITQKRLMELLTYNPKTGNFIRKKTNGRGKKGKIAGCKDHDGYILISVDSVRQKAHRLAFLYMEGFIPEHQIDHINGNPSDNRWINLRHVSRACNHQNRKINKNNKTGIPGVNYLRVNKKYRAEVLLNNKKVHLGVYKNKLNAALARLTFEIDCPDYTCDRRGNLILAIERLWPDFKLPEGVYH